MHAVASALEDSGAASLLDLELRASLSVTERSGLSTVLPSIGSVSLNAVADAAILAVWPRVVTDDLEAGSYVFARILTAGLMSPLRVGDAASCVVEATTNGTTYSVPASVVESEPGTAIVQCHVEAILDNLDVHLRVNIAVDVGEPPQHLR